MEKLYSITDAVDRMNSNESTTLDEVTLLREELLVAMEKGKVLALDIGDQKVEFGKFNHSEIFPVLTIFNASHGKTCYSGEASATHACKLENWAPLKVNEGFILVFISKAKNEWSLKEQMDNVPAVLSMNKVKIL